MASDKILKITLTEEEYEWATKSRGYVRQLIQQDMGGGVQINVQPVNTRPQNIPATNFKSTFRCRACGGVKMSGRCIKDGCSLRGKLQ